MAMLFDMNIKLFYATEEGLMKQEFIFPSTSALGIKKTQASKQKIQLFLAADGYFDVVYDKSYIKSAGICQSVLLDVCINIITSLIAL